MVYKRANSTEGYVQMALRPCKECKKEISTDAKVCPHCGKKVGTSTAAGCLAVFFGLIILGWISSPLHHSEEGTTPPNVGAGPKNIARSQISLEYKWRKEGFDDIMEADFTVKNGSVYDVKDLEIVCEHYAKSGTQIDSNKRTIYDVVKAHSTKQFKNFNMGFIHTQSEKSSCSITDFSVAP